MTRAISVSLVDNDVDQSKICTVKIDFNIKAMPKYYLYQGATRYEQIHLY